MFVVSLWIEDKGIVIDLGEKGLVQVTLEEIRNDTARIRVVAENTVPIWERESEWEEEENRE